MSKPSFFQFFSTSFPFPSLANSKIKVFTLLVPVLRYFLHVLIYEPAARAILRVPPPPPSAAAAAPKKPKQKQQKSGSRKAPLSTPAASTSLAEHARAAAELARARDPGQKLVARFAESAWKLSAYVFLLLLGSWAVAREPWSRVLAARSGGEGATAAAADALWLGWPLAKPSLPLSLYYLAEGSFYLASLFMLLHWEVKRKDFAAMLTHHGESFVF